MKKWQFGLLIGTLLVVVCVTFSTAPMRVAHAGEMQQGGVLTQISPGVPVPIAALNATVQTVISSGPSILAPGQCTNADATNWAYVQIFDVAGTPIAGTTANKQSFGIPPAGGSIVPTSPLLFVNSIKVAATTTATGATNAVTSINCNFNYRQ